ncbi:MAG TPA: response regulator [Aggregatilineales bacterium]|nr:response regulator [Anaerolineales bacterium]HRE49536.1 response regulator [Aggregatilineales bacterium]
MQPQVLIVDDNPQHRLLLGAQVRMLGCAVLQATGGSEALDVIERRTPPVDLVITDVWMPEMSGIELLKAIRTRVPEMPIALISAAADLESSLEAINAGAYAYLKKPFSQNDVRDLIGRGLTRLNELRAARMLTQIDAIGGESHAVISDLLTGLRHELSNITQAIRLNLDSMKEQERIPNTIHENFSDLETSLDDLLSVLARVKEFPAAGETNQRIDMGDLLERVVEDIQRLAPRARVTFRAPAETVLVTGSERDLYRAVFNVVRNAVEASPKVQVSLAVNGTVLISVADQGQGFPREVLARPFTPGLTTKAPPQSGAHGKGWGLFITRTILALHKGEISLANLPEGGALATIRLPLAARHMAAAG